MRFFLLVATFLFFCTPTSHAQNSHTISQGIGTSGSFIAYTKQLNPKISLGASISFLNLDATIPLKIIGQEVKVIVQTSSLQGSVFYRYHPFGKKDSIGFRNNGFFLSAGLSQKTSSIYELRFTSREPLQIGQFKLTSDQTGSVNIDVFTNTTMPWFSIGYQKKFRNNKLSILSEVGLYYHGLPLIDMNSTGVFRLNDRNKDQIQKNISSLKYYPLLNVSLGYKLQSTKPNPQ
jgi:hypothetical protein